MTSLSESLRELKGINGGLSNTLRKLRVEIEKLEKEKADLFKEIDGLKATGKERVSTLREEIETLRGEVKVFRKLIDTSPEKAFGEHHITDERNTRGSKHKKRKPRLE
jgi:chromosome segregation ATPase